MGQRAKLVLVGLMTIALAPAVVIYVRRLETRVQLPIGVPPKPEPPACEPIELSGILRRPKAPMPRLELVPGGPLDLFNMDGPLIVGVPDGTPIRVKAVARSYLNTSDTPEERAQFPAQWIVYFLVTELEVLQDPLTVMKERARREMHIPEPVPLPTGRE